MEPLEIKKLDGSVINRIAAGEIIQRPGNCLKELLENSLDAKSTYIQVSIKEGGLKLLQIQDNGTGIRKEDLEIVCERFTTSKLSKFEDLSEIGTFGFRGEALASISHVAHLTIQTKTNLDKCAYKALFEDGRLKGSSKPCAGNQGTIIIVEDLFYNVPQRKQVLKSPAEEFQKITDIVNKYAVHNPKIGFMLKKFGDSPAIKTPINSSAEENIKIIYGQSIGKELIEIGFDDNIHKFKVKGYISNPNYSGKKGILLIFINNRLVDSISIKAALDSVYAIYLPKGSHPFVYLSLELDPRTVDVNVHPTKHEVHFLNEDDIVEKVKLHIEKKLLGGNSARTVYKQTRAPSTFDKISTDAGNSNKIQAKDIIRTDSKEQKLDKFLISSQNSSIKIKIEGNSVSSGSQNPKRITKLTSVLNMREKIEQSESSILRLRLRESVFVGVADKYTLFQHENKLYMTDTNKLSKELFSQILIYNFQNFSELQFDPKLSICDLLEISLDSDDSGWTEEDGPKIKLAERATEILIEKSNIMSEYFGLKITNDGLLESLPILLDNHVPEICKLPNYLLRLATEVNWEEEVECFENFFTETAYFYSYLSESDVASEERKNWLIEHCVFPAIKKLLIPSIKLKKHFFELANLPNLYKVFERC